jgi:hypothetical protein
MKIRYVLGAALLATAISGCAAETEPMEEEVSETQSEELKKNLVGKWEADSGPIYNIEFTKEPAAPLGSQRKDGLRFVATIDTGIRCITTPCPSSLEVSGIYYTRGSNLQLVSYDRPSRELARYLGDYRYTVSAKKLSMTKKDDPTIAGKLHRAPQNAGQPCGEAVCGEGTFCCNPLRSLCVPEGRMCIQ